MSSINDGMMMIISTPVGDNGINMSSTVSYPPPVYKYIYNSDGIAISRTLTDGSVIMEKYVLFVLETKTDLPGPSIPFGMYFLVFAVISIFALAIFIKNHYTIFKR